MDECLRRVKEQSDDIILVDDGSPSPVTPSGIRCLRNETNRGFAYSVNRGIESCDGDVILLNNDCLIEPGCLESLCEVSRETQGIVGAKLLYPNRTIQHAGVTLYGGSPIHLGVGLNESFHDTTEKVFAVTFGLVYIPRPVIEQVGLLDERYFIAYEDIAYCLRAKEKGFPVVFDADAKAIHLEGHTRGDRPSNKDPFWLKKELEGKHLFYSEWGEYLENASC